MNQLQFDNEKYERIEIPAGKGTIRVRAFEHICYVAHPVDEDWQQLSIYVPEVFYEGMEINGRNLHNAPIFLPNTVGGYRPGYFQRPGLNHHDRISASAYALERGFVVFCPMTRGIGQTKEGKNIGMAPATIVDLKAAVRWLRFNKETVPGDTERIISNGTSAGGNMSALLGATGNHPDYEPYLKALGACDERDDIFASSCYCPISILEEADKAYEWEFKQCQTGHVMAFEIDRQKAEQFGVTEDMIESLYHDGHPDFKKLTEEQRRNLVHPVIKEITMPDEQMELSKELASLFPAYVNALGLKNEEGKEIFLDEDGNGTLKDFICETVIASVNKAHEEGTDFSEYDWITWKEGKAVSIDFDAYAVFRTRMKLTPAFDHTGMPASPENQIFLDETQTYSHFSSFSYTHDVSEWPCADTKQVKLYNPMPYIVDEKADTAKYFRIMAGAVDRDTSLSVSALLTLNLRNHGSEADYHIPWGIPHSGDYDIDELFAWIDHIL